MFARGGELLLFFFFPHGPAWSLALIGADAVSDATRMWHDDDGWMYKWAGWSLSSGRVLLLLLLPFHILAPVFALCPDSI
jgi:hypothetical protein